ncbi:MAG: chemotaxis protein CheW [Anaerolineae bacterium]|nr:chemotaxis protein CheW [Anaerolineae bacterium]
MMPVSESVLLPVLPLRCDVHNYALPLESVVEVAAMVALVPVPGASDALLGLANRGGEALPILSLRALVGLAPRSLDAQTMFVVVQAGDAQFGLVADEVEPVRYYPQNAWKRMERAGHWVSHTISEQGKLTQVLHAVSLMSAAVRVHDGKW